MISIRYQEQIKKHYTHPANFTFWTFSGAEKDCAQARIRSKTLSAQSTFLAYKNANRLLLTRFEDHERHLAKTQRAVDGHRGSFVSVFHSRARASHMEASSQRARERMNERASSRASRTFSGHRRSVAFHAPPLRRRRRRRRRWRRRRAFSRSSARVSVTRVLRALVASTSNKPLID